MGLGKDMNQVLIRNHELHADLVKQPNRKLKLPQWTQSFQITTLLGKDIYISTQKMQRLYYQQSSPFRNFFLVF